MAGSILAGGVEVCTVIISEVDETPFPVMVTNGTVGLEVAAVAMIGVLLPDVIIADGLLPLLLREKTIGLVVDCRVLTETPTVEVVSVIKVEKLL